MGDIQAGSNVNLDAFVQNASDEMDSKLGFLYEVPFVQAHFAPWVWTLIKQTANKIATGRLLLALNSGGEASAENAYGAGLLKEGLTALQEMVTGSMVLPGATPVASPSSTDGNGPTILVADQFSGVDTFYSNVMDPPLVPPYNSPWTPFWRPGRRGGIGPLHGVEVPTPGTRG